MNASLRIVGFVAILAVVFGVAWAAGSAWGPSLDEPERREHDGAAHTAQEVPE